eukprot:TRINITY_DN4326_c0_g1_i4.p1 TRINITY_DN4326_c0_g1~~TRINITY_DN4326_c0_g1_i4.p1  ORF type:complete len:337 (-),score=41.88 TRINITY_DN4326_c0_g1_i4:74-1084(-)
MSGSVARNTTAHSFFQRIWKKFIGIFVWNFLYFMGIYFLIHSLFSALCEIQYGRIKSAIGALNILFGMIGLAANIFLTFHLFIMIRVINPIQNSTNNNDSDQQQNQLQRNETNQNLTFNDIGNEEQQRITEQPSLKQQPWYIRIYSFKFGSQDEKKAFLDRHQIIVGKCLISMHMKQDFLQYEVIRLVIITFNAIFLLEHSQVQTLLNILVLVFYFMNLIYNSISKQFIIMAALSILAESAIILSYFGAFLFSQYDINGEGTNLNVFKNIEYIVMFGVLIAIYLQLFQLFAVLCQEVKASIGVIKNSMKKKQSIKPQRNQQINQFSSNNNTEQQHL